MLCPFPIPDECGEPAFEEVRMEESAGPDRDPTGPAPLALWEILVVAAGVSAGCGLIATHTSSLGRAATNWIGQIGLLLPLAFAPIVMTDFQLGARARFRGRDRLALLFHAVPVSTLLLLLALARRWDAYAFAVYLPWGAGLVATIWAVATWGSRRARPRRGWKWLVPAAPVVQLLAFLAR